MRESRKDLLGCELVFKLLMNEKERMEVVG